jgi:hypothetical protein
MRLLAGAFAVQLVPLTALDLRMRRTGGTGIIPFELAGPEQGAVTMERWGTDGRAAARCSLLLDFPFPATYAPLQALLCVEASQRLAQDRKPRLASIGSCLASAQFVAAGFDYIENLALLATLADHMPRAPTLARRAACTKFAILTPTWVYLLCARIVTRATPNLCPTSE